MANRPTGRRRTGVGGGGNATRRGSGLGTGRVGSSSRPSGFGSSGSAGGSGGQRATGGSGGLLALILGLVLGRVTSGNSNTNSGSQAKRGCLSRILILIVMIVAVVLLFKLCSSSGMLDGYTDAISGTPGGLNELVQGGGSETEGSAGFDASTLFSGIGGATEPVSSSDIAYREHEPDRSVNEAARRRLTRIAGDGEDVYTVMIFMCGADLESGSGLATRDLQEMTNASLSDNVHIVVETGGATKWNNNVISAKTNQRYEVKAGGLKPLEKDLGKRSMVEPDTLSDFISYCVKKFPADRYALIFWDHGGGSISGFGYDQFFPKDGMSLGEINKALKDGGCEFDFIGFDACLMGSLETAVAVEPYADYLIASEAVEPGTGWYYTDWLSELSENTSMDTLDIGKAIIDSYVKKSGEAAPRAGATLSMIDLAELAGTLPESFRTFSEGTGELIENDNYDRVADARASARDFSNGTKINQIDVIHFAENLGTDEANALADVLRSAVKYNRISQSVTHANGLSIYFPYNSLKTVSAAVNTYESIGLDESYSDCIKSFASMAAGGAVASGGSANPLGSLTGDVSGSLLGSLLGSSTSSSGSADMVTSLLEAFLTGSDRSIVTGDSDNSWIDGDLLLRSTEYFEKNAVGLGNLMVSENAKGERVLAMNEEQWALVRMLELNIFVDDGEGYIDLGLDNVFDWDDEGNLIMEYDGTWLSLNGQIVSYYFISQQQIDDEVIITGYVPAMVNGQRVNIIVVFDDDSPAGRVEGAQTDYGDLTDTVMKGLVEIVDGDRIDFLCDYYTYDGEYSDSYYLGEQMIASGEFIIGNAPVGAERTLMTYKLTDIYGANYWTATVE